MNAAEVLIINLNKNMDLNADVIEGFNVNLDGYKVIAVNLDKNTDDALAFLNRVKNESKGTRSIGVSEKVSISLIQRIIECGGVFRLLENTNNLQEAIQEATASSAPEATMNGADNANKLQALTDDLEALIDRREKSLHRANKRALNTNKQTVALYHALLAVHEAKSVAEVETLLLTVLQNPLELVWVRVFYVDPTDLETHLSRLQKLHFYKTPLKVGSESLGFIVFARAVDRAFSKGEDELLHQVSESVALALDRLAKQDQTETLKQQWDSTFNAISEPLCLTDENFNILRTNKRFCETVGLPERKLVGKNAFAQFADPDTPPTRHASSDRFLIQRHFGGSREPRYFEVTSQRVAGGDKSVVMILFRDVTEQKRIERQIFEASKMAELGTIGSSIAHEINNPLAGMMSFLQLIKMDLKKEDPLRSDIEEMERGSRRCKEIVESLLSFSRRQSSAGEESIDLREVLGQALRIVELQTRSLGIDVALDRPEAPVLVKGQYNVLSQALSHVLQNAVEAVSDRLNRSPGFSGQIRVEFQNEPDEAVIIISDNGVGISPEHQSKIFDPLFSTKRTKTGLGLSLAYKIIDEHRGRLEIFSQPNIGTRVKISFLKV